MTEKIRLQRYLSTAGVAARRKAEELIVAGHVRVNGKQVRLLGSKVDPSRDHVTVNGEAIHPLDKFYVVFNKPKGCVTAVEDDRGRATVMEYLPNLPVPVRPVGRLDYYAEGVVLLTNDGELAARLTSSQHEVPKTYHVKVHGEVAAKHLESLRAGVRLEDGSTTQPAEVNFLPGESRHSWLGITVVENKQHQVQRMLEALGYQVQKLQCVAFATLNFHGLRVGDGRELNQGELNSIRDLVGLDHSVTTRGVWRTYREDTDIPRRAREKLRVEAAESEAEAGGEPISDWRDADSDSYEARPARGAADRGGRDERAPSRDDRKRAPSRDDRKRGPARDDRKRAPSRDDRKRGPARDDRKRGTARDDRSERDSRNSQGTRSDRKPAGRSADRSADRSPDRSPAPARSFSDDRLGSRPGVRAGTSFGARDDRSARPGRPGRPNAAGSFGSREDRPSRSAGPERGSARAVRPASRPGRPAAEPRSVGSFGSRDDRPSRSAVPGARGPSRSFGARDDRPDSSAGPRARGGGAFRRDDRPSGRPSRGPAAERSTRGDRPAARAGQGTRPAADRSTRGDRPAARRPAASGARPRPGQDSPRPVNKASRPTSASRPASRPARRK